MTEPLWLVWVASGEHDNYSNDLRGIFPTETLAQAFAAVVTTDKDDEVTVTEQAILHELPRRVIVHRWSAHITVDGQEYPGLGYHRDVWDWPCWQHERPACESRIGEWGHGARDLFIEVTGYDHEKVEQRYAELLAEARQRLAAGGSA